MSYTLKNYPASFQMLRQDLIKIAVETANNLIMNGFRENVAEMAAIGSAKLFGTGNGSDSRVHLVPHPKGWGLISSDAKSIFFISSSRTDALIRARAKAKCQKLRLFIHSLSGIITDSESFSVNSPSKQIIIKRQEEYLEELAVNPSAKVQERTREAIRKAKMFAQKVQKGLSLNNGEVSNKLTLDY